jgi:hypothetical protein
MTHASLKLRRALPSLSHFGQAGPTTRARRVILRAIAGYYVPHHRQSQDKQAPAIRLFQKPLKRSYKNSVIIEIMGVYRRKTTRHINTPYKIPCNYTKKRVLEIIFYA